MSFLISDRVKRLANRILDPATDKDNTPLDLTPQAANRPAQIPPSRG